jgi:hypothetical protein
VKSLAGYESLRLARRDDECDTPFERGLFSRPTRASSRLVPSVAQSLRWKIEMPLRFTSPYDEDYSTRQKQTRSPLISSESQELFPAARKAASQKEYGSVLL